MNDDAAASFWRSPTSLRPWTGSETKVQAKKQITARTPSNLQNDFKIFWIHDGP